MKQTIDAVATEIVTAGEAEVRLALVAYRDYTDRAAFQTVPFTEDLASFRAHVGVVAAGLWCRAFVADEAVVDAARVEADVVRRGAARVLRGLPE